MRKTWKRALAAISAAVMIFTSVNISPVLDVKAAPADTAVSDESTPEYKAVFPSVVGESVTLEAENATELQDETGNHTNQWSLQVSEGTWASGGYYLNCLNANASVIDKALYAYNAPVAGTYTVTVTYRSGDPNNTLAWSEVDGKIENGRVSAGADDSAGANHTAEFTMKVVTAGAGTLVLYGPNTNAPQLDKFDIVLTEAAEVPVVDTVSEMVANMSLRDKVTQMLMVDFRYWDEDLTDDVGQTGFTVMNDQVRKIVEDYNFGALIYFAQNLTGTEQSYNLTMAMQEAATKDGGIPMIISADQEGGNVYRLGTGTALPGNMALGATFNTEYAKKAGQIIGSELSSLGINTNLAPVVDVNNNANNPVIGLRSYGDDAIAVGEMASASIAGMAEYNVIGCAKHFPGHGDTATDSHYGLPIVDKSLDVLKETELKPYEVAIKQGIEMIMTAHILYPQLESDTIVSAKTGEAESLPATMSDDILTDLLKGEMGFEGIIVTDAMNMAGVADKWDQVQSVKIAIAAGVDMICMPCVLYNEEDLADLDAIIDGVIEAVESEEIPESRINDAVTRILTVKENRGILDYDAADYTLENALATVGSDTNRATEREIAAAAVTVVKNTDNVLPLDITADTNVLMLVPYNNERGQMLMGWNRAVEAGIIPYGAEVDYYRFSSATINATLQEKLEWADVVIINSEISSTARMAYKHWLSALPKAVTEYCAANDKISVISSVDKPYDVQLYPDADAIVAAYGCKGSTVDPTEALVGGVTTEAAAYGPNIIAAVEVILGTYTAQGKLPVNIPTYDVENNAYDTSNLVYERGYGLTYAAEEEKTPIEVTDASVQALAAAIENYDEADLTDKTPATAAAYEAALTEAQAVYAAATTEGETVTEYALLAAAADLEAAYNGLAVKANKEALQAAVDAAVTDFTAYTKGSEAVYSEALEAAQAVLNNENAVQDEADEALEALEAATAGLEKLDKYAYDLTVLAANASASSEQDPPAWTDDGYASWAFDTENHWWHSKYKIESDNDTTEGIVSADTPQWIQTGFGEVWYVDSITYLPRGQNMNVFKDYTVSVANLEDPAATPTDEDFTPVKSGTLADLAEAQTIQLDEVVAATHVRITVTSVYTTGRAYVAAKQINVYGYDVMPTDTTALAALVDECKTIDQTVYTAATAAPFAEAITAAEAVLADARATQAEADEAATALAEAKDALALLANAASKDALTALVNECNGLSMEGCTVESVTALTSALTAANEVLANADASQAEVEAATETLTTAKEGLAKLGDKTELNALIAEILEDAYSEDDYTVETWRPFHDALVAAQEVAADEDASEAEVEEALTNLFTTVNALEARKDPADATNDYPAGLLTAISSNEYTPGDAKEGPDDYILDGNNQTYWHTDWTNKQTHTGPAEDNRWVGFVFPELTTISAVRYLPRQGVIDSNSGAGNGRVLEYAVQVRSTSDGEWTTVATGEVGQTDTTWQLIEFAEDVEVLELRLLGVETYSAEGSNAHMSAAELRAVLPTAFVVEQTGVEAISAKDTYVLGEALSLTVNKLFNDGTKEAVAEDGYTVTGYDANTIGTQTVTVTVGEYTATVEVKVIADKAALTTAVNAANRLKEADYTADTWAPFAAALAAAEEVLDNDAATQAAVDEAKAALEDAQAKLVEVVHKENLKAAIDDAKELVAEDYTEESWKAVADALTEAEAVYANAEATQEVVDAAEKALEDAVKALAAKPVPTPTPDVKPDPTPTPDVKPDPTPTPDVKPDDKPFRFDDVQDESAYYFNPVYWAYDNGITTGITETLFAPDNDVIRADMVTLLWRAAGSPTPENTVCTFEDVDPEQYYYTAMLWAIEEGITQGYNDKEFGTTDTCTRAQMVTFLWRMKDQTAPKTKDCPFADVAATDYYYNAVLWAVENGITTGVNATTFAPNDNCTRGQAVTFLNRTLVPAE